MILPLGDPRLYEVSLPVVPDEVDSLRSSIGDLHDILFEFRAKYNAGRAIAAPQIGVMKRLIYMHVGTPTVIMNPVLSELSPEMFELWDDCMCFPNLLVRLKRHRSLRLTFRDENWKEHSWVLTESMAELVARNASERDSYLIEKKLGW